ncbi:MAG: alpha/beta fold hydrolase [Candidatus Methylomirabilia bacterium]
MTQGDRWITVNGLKFHYIEWGAPPAPTLVLLHGFTGHARTWDHFAESAADRFRVLTLDQRGHGDSDWAPDADYGATSMAGDLEAFVDALCPGRFSLLGLSMGGRVSIVYAGAHPERVERLILVDIGPDIAPEGMRRILTTVSTVPEELESEEQAYQLLRAADPRYSEPLLRHRVKHSLTRLPNGKLAWKYDKALRDRAGRGGRDLPNLWPDLARIACPTLIIRGAESDVLSPHTAKRMLETIKEARLVEVPEAGHAVVGDQPETFAQVARDFLLNDHLP